ncbi:tetratricopeptide repeat protein [Candidatus Collierbacteria bacterium]|nr:tetratricopeptide repeat protein [Candidatus Collierbacteria bacterium]
MESQRARQIHLLEEQAREKGEFTEALKFAEEALVAYVEDDDLLGAAEVLAAQVLIYRHLFEKTEKKAFLLLAEVAATKSVRMAGESGQPEALAIPNHTLGKVYEDMGKWQEAVAAQQKAIEITTTTPPASHNRPAFLAEIRTHLFADKYMAGDKSALTGLDEAIVALEGETVELKYNRDVWLSGGYMSKAKVLKADNPAMAKEAMQKAKAVIDANSELTLRKQQWEKLAKEIPV